MLSSMDMLQTAVHGHNINCVEENGTICRHRGYHGSPGCHRHKLGRKMWSLGDGDSGVADVEKPGQAGRRAGLFRRRRHYEVTTSHFKVVLFLF